MNKDENKAPKLPPRKSQKNKTDEDGSPDGPKFNMYWIYAIIAVFGLIFLLPNFFSNSGKKIYVQEFETMLRNGELKKVVLVNDKVAELYLTDAALAKHKAEDPNFNKGTLPGVPGPQYFFKIISGEQFSKDLEKIETKYPGVTTNLIVEPIEKSSFMKDWGQILIPIALLILFWMFIMRRMSGGMGGGQIFNIGKSKAALFDGNTSIRHTFADVAGLDEAKEEVMEIVDFLKMPKKYTALGGKIPKGALLIGPPGTGKTLLAKAMAGEAQVPFFSISGSDFVEMFVGVGASRVRDLFQQARAKAPCIIFIDEIDAIGRARGKTLIQGNDERENTLNQLLVEMDGFSGDKGVIILAATNRPDVLDGALMRPGRFDRQIFLDRPDLKGREQIFKVHLKPIKTAAAVDPAKLSQLTPGFVGADIANICNEAALIAARHGKKEVGMDDFNDAVDRVIGGLEKKNKIITPEEKEVIAYHEAGHAICGWYLEHAYPLVKVTIVPRGKAGGYNQFLPNEKNIERTEELLDRICMTMGGRAAEFVVYGKISTGASGDLDHVTKMAYSMTTIYGMSEKVGNISYYDMLSDGAFQKPYSEETGKLIDEEMRGITDGQYKRAIQLLRDKREELDKMAKALLAKEVLHKDEIELLIGPRPFDNKVIPINKENDKKEENGMQSEGDAKTETV